MNTERKRQTERGDDGVEGGRDRRRVGKRRRGRRNGVCGEDVEEVWRGGDDE
jgi:hypothetical protein